MSRRNVTLSLDPEIVERGKSIAGLIPFSRFVESLLLREIARENAAEEDGHDR
jgi:hypothetical protein